jgi:hypothetical protein
VQNNRVLLASIFINEFDIIPSGVFHFYLVSRKGGCLSQIICTSLNELLLIAHLRDHKSLGHDPNKGLLTINLDIDSSSSFPYNSEGNKLTLDGCRNNGDIISVFIENEYSFLPVEEKTVIDIGANIADSPSIFV